MPTGQIARLNNTGVTVITSHHSTPYDLPIAESRILINALMHNLKHQGEQNFTRFCSGFIECNILFNSIFNIQRTKSYCNKK